MIWFIYAYFLIYVVFGAWICIEGLMRNDPWWDNTLDFVFFFLSALGIYFFVTDNETAEIRNLWKPVSILLLVGQLFTNLYGRYTALKEFEEPPPNWAQRLTDLGTIVIVSPAILINLEYAYNFA